METDSLRRMAECSSFVLANESPLGTKRSTEAATYSRFNSKASHLLPSASATMPVVLEPAKMSTTRSPGSVSKRMKNSGNFAGKRAGCPLIPNLLTCPQVDSVAFGVWNLQQVRRDRAAVIGWQTQGQSRARKAAAWAYRMLPGLPAASSCAGCIQSTHWKHLPWAIPSGKTTRVY